MNIEELQVKGSALVTAVDDCPEIADGEGSVVTARFCTREVHTVARVEILGPDGQVETLEGTTIHPIWSEDRQDWIPLGELLPGEQLRSLQTSPFELQTSTVLSVLILNQPTAVYNIEVHGEHVYQVGKLRLLVHNSYVGELGEAIAKGMKVIQGAGAPDQLVGVLAKLGRNVDRNMVREAIHAAKRRMSMGATDDLVFDLSGGMWDS